MCSTNGNTWFQENWLFKLKYYVLIFVIVVITDYILPTEAIECPTPGSLRIASSGESRISRGVGGVGTTEPTGLLLYGGLCV